MVLTREKRRIPLGRGETGLGQVVSNPSQHSHPHCDSQGTGLGENSDSLCKVPREPSPPGQLHPQMFTMISPNLVLNCVQTFPKYSTYLL